MHIYVICNGRTKEYEADPIYEYVYSDDADACVREILSYEEGPEDEIIGFFSDGRFLVRNDQPLIAPYIEKVLKKYDLILPYEVETDGSGFSRIFAPGMVIGCRHLLAGYYAGLSDDERRSGSFLEDAYPMKKWILKNGYRVKSEALSADNSEKWNIGYQRINVLQQYIDTLLGEYISLRKQTGFGDSFAEENPYEGDFEGKTPVWICWWQGLDEAPELIKACVSSVLHNLPDNTFPIIITLDNWDKYVIFTDTVIDKFNKNVISYTHLADMLRCELVYRYGGLWIDATYFVSAPVPEYVFDEEFYSLAFEKPLWGMDIMRGRWSSSLLGAAKRHSPVMQFMMEGLWLYWEQLDETIDYFFWDYILDAGYRHFDEIRSLIDSIKPSPDEVYDLQLEMNQRISDKDIERLKRDSFLYKINRRNEYRKITEHGFKTFFSYVIDGENEDATVGISIEVGSTTDLIGAVRETNPYLIIDENGFFYQKEYVSRGLLDDLLLHECRILLSESGRGAASETNYIYEGIVSERRDEIPVARIVTADGYSIVCY